MGSHRLWCCKGRVWQKWKDQRGNLNWTSKGIFTMQARLLRHSSFPVSSPLKPIKLLQNLPKHWSHCCHGGHLNIKFPSSLILLQAIWTAHFIMGPLNQIKAALLWSNQGLKQLLQREGLVQKSYLHVLTFFFIRFCCDHEHKVHHVSYSPVQNNRTLLNRTLFISARLWYDWSSKLSSWFQFE